MRRVNARWRRRWWQRPHPNQWAKLIRRARAHRRVLRSVGDTLRSATDGDCHVSSSSLMRHMLALYGLSSARGTSDVKIVFALELCKCRHAKTVCQANLSGVVCNCVTDPLTSRHFLSIRLQIAINHVKLGAAQWVLQRSQLVPKYFRCLKITRPSMVQ